MSLASMMTESVTVLVHTTGAEDSTGDDLPTFPDGATVAAYVEQTATTERIVGRDQVVSEWLFILPADTAVTEYDRLRWSGRVFAIVGEPQRPIKPGQGVHHIEARARWVEG